MFVRAAGSRLDGPWLSILAALLRRLNAAGKKPDGVSWSGIRSHRVDDCPYLGHFGRRKAPQLGMRFDLHTVRVDWVILGVSARHTNRGPSEDS